MILRERAMGAVPDSRATQINVALLGAVRDAIRETPTQFHIGGWHYGDIVPGASDKASNTACIAGWAAVLHDRQRLSKWSGEYIEARAKKLLRVNDEEGNRLFFCGLWPRELYEKYRHVPVTLEDFEANATVAARRIDLFILSNGVP